MQYYFYYIPPMFKMQQLGVGRSRSWDGSVVVPDPEFQACPGRAADEGGNGVLERDYTNSGYTSRGAGQWQ